MTTACGTIGRRQRWLAVVVAVVMSGAALAIRLPRLNVFITPDELKWVCRSINFYRGLQSGELAQTRQTGHPGVITMWLGAPFMQADVSQPWLAACTNPSISDLIEEQGPDRPQELGRYLFGARRGVVWFTSIGLGLSVLLLARLFGLRVAGLAGLLMVFDPYITAHSRFLHLDAVTTTLLFLSVLLLLTARRSRRWPWFAVSGVTAGLAMLNKSPAGFIIPFTGMVLACDWLWGHRSFSKFIHEVLVWGGAAALTAFAAWPAMWVQPAATLKLVVDTALFYAENPHSNSSYFMGSPRPDPGPGFYPAALAFRTTPVSFIGLLLGLPWTVRKNDRRAELWVCGAFVLLFGLFMTVGQKKADRYLLPVLPFVDVIAAVGFWKLIDWVSARCKENWQSVVRGAAIVLVAAALVLTTVGVLRTAPYYLTYYNPLFGGIKAAEKVILVGWGEGLEQAAAFLNERLDGQSAIAVSRSVPSFAPFFRGTAIQADGYDPATMRYVVIYINELQRRLGEPLLQRTYDRIEPAYVVTIDGIKYVYVYENRTAADAIAYLDEHAEPGRDAILVSRPSLFTDTYKGDLPVYVVDPAADHASILRQLDQIRATAQRVWYVSYWQKNPNPTNDWVQFQLRTHAKAGEHAELTDVSVSSWDLSDAISFQSTGVSRTADVIYDSELALESYDLVPGEARYGSGTGLIMHWRVDKQLHRYLALYVHVLDDAGRRWGQGDAWLVDQALRQTVDWIPGVPATQYVPIELAPGIMPGKYHLVMGVRDRLGDADPKASRASGEALGSEVELGELTVAPSPWSAGQDLPVQTETAALADGLTLVGWRDVPSELYMGDSVDVALYWRAEHESRPDYDVELSLVASDGAVLASHRSAVSAAVYPTSAWRSGEVLGAYYGLTLPDDAAAADATLQVRLFASGQEADGVVYSLGPVKVYGRLRAEPIMGHAQPAELGGGIAFLGYDVSPKASAGGTVELTLYWHALKRIDTSYTVFTHLLDADGVVKGQLDSIPMSGHLPTTAWQAGTYVADRYIISVDAAAKPGDYRIEIGMYDALADYARVPLTVGGVRQQDDRLLLDTTIAITSQTP